MSEKAAATPGSWVGDYAYTRLESARAALENAFSYADYLNDWTREIDLAGSEIQRVMAARGLLVANVAVATRALQEAQKSITDAVAYGVPTG